MALSTAPLGNLPYMNLARYVPDRIDEPAWHKALSAFLVNSAAGAGRDLTSNAMSPDETQRAIQMGLIPSNTQAPGMGSRLLHGPGVSMSDLQTMIKDKNFQSNQDREYEAMYGKNGEQARRDAETQRHNKADEGTSQARADNEKAYQGGMLGVEGKRYDEEHADRQSNAATNAASKSEQVRRDQQAEKDREADEGRKDKQTNAYVQAENDRDAAEKSKAAMVKWAMDGGKGPAPSSEDNSAAPGNSSNSNPNATVTPSVPGGQASPTQGMTAPEWFKLGMPGGSPPQQSGGVQQSNSSQAPSASGPGMQGQAPQAFQQPSADGINLNSLLAPTSQENVMAQSVGQMGGSPATGTPPNPYSGTGAVGASAYAPPIQFSPQMMQAAYALARAKGQPQGMGGTPGVGGLPLGYG